MIQQGVLGGNGPLAHLSGLRRLLALYGLNELIELVRGCELSESRMGLEPHAERQPECGSEYTLTRVVASAFAFLDAG